MSGEGLTRESEKIEPIVSVQRPRVYPGKTVNINDLIAKVKKDKIKERKEGYIFVGLACFVLLITGIISSF